MASIGAIAPDAMAKSASAAIGGVAGDDDEVEGDTPIDSLREHPHAPIRASAKKKTIRP
jgi:hypothetical protein